MTCDEVIELMQRHLDGDLNEEEHKRLSEHLDACPECADMMERLTQIDQDLANLPKVTPAFSLVDSILPRLEQLEAGNPDMRTDAAASEMQLIRTERAAASGAEGGEERQRPWYARNRLAQFGGLAAAAAVFGILIVNGLPKQLDDAAKLSTESSAGSAPMARMMSTSAADAEESAVASDATGDSANEAPTANSVVPPQSAKAPQEPPAEPPAEPVPMLEVEAPNRESGSGEVDIAEVPPAAPAVPATPPSAPSDARQSSGPDAVPEELPPVGGAPSLQDGTGEPAAAPEVEPSGGDMGIMKIDNQGESPSLPSESGKYAAEIRPMSEDGKRSVVIVDDAGTVVFASGILWDDAVPLELKSWDGDVLTYAAIQADGETRLFSIDAAAGSEAELN